MSSLAFLDEDSDEAETQGRSGRQPDSLQDQCVSIKRNARTVAVQDTPAAPRNSKRTKPAESGFGGFSAFANAPSQQHTDGDCKMDEEAVSFPSKATTSARDSTCFGEGAITRRNNTSAQMALGGGFSARISELKLDAISFRGDRLFKDEDTEDSFLSEHTPESEERVHHGSPSNFTYMSQAELAKKSAPDKAIMKTSRFGPPLTRSITDDPGLLPFSSFWEEAETAHDKTQKWLAEMTVSPGPSLSEAAGCTKKVRFLESKPQP